MEKLKNEGHTIISIVNKVGSSIATLTGHGVYMNAKIEKAVAATKSFMNSCICLILIALWYSYNK